MAEVEQPAPIQITSEEPVSDCTIVKNYQWDTRIAYAVCMAESRGNSQAVGDNYVIAGLYAPSCGLMQIRTLAGRPSCDELLNPETNMEWAWKISNNGTNWKPWSAFTNGSYERYL